MNARTVIPIVFIIVLLVGNLALAASWGKFQTLEEIVISAGELSKTIITWHPFSKAYDTGNLVIGIQPINITFNASATEKKFVIEIAGADTGYHLDLAFFDTGVIDVVETTPNGATKLADTSASGIHWQNVQFIIVEINRQEIKLKTDNETVLASVTWSTAPSTIEQIGASGGENSVISGNVYIAVLYDPYSGITSSTTGIIYSIIPVMIAIISIVIPLVFLKTIMRWVEKIF